MDENSNNKKQLFWSRKMIEKFIQIYKENECLYDMGHPNFNNERIKSDALKNILKKMQQYLPNLELYDVEDKIKAIRTQYANEISLIEEAKALGNKYVSNLWCFEQLDFLRKHMTSSTTSNQMKEETTFFDESDDDKVDSEDSDVSLYTERNNTTKAKRPYSRKFQWNRDGLKFFIKMIKNHPILYNPNHKDYSNRDLRCLERNKLLKELRKIDLEINLNDIRYKMRCLRKQFMKEVRLLKKAHASNETYIPRLWCFDRLADLYRYEIDITAFYNKNIEIDDNSNSTSPIHELGHSVNNGTYEFTQIHEIDKENDEVYEVETSNALTIDMTQNNEDVENSLVNECDNTIEGDLEDVTPPKKWCNYNANFQDKMNNRRTNYAISENSINDSGGVQYSWLGDLVISQLCEIAPKYYNDFAWDVQCLIRKYVLKTKTNNDETTASQSSTTTFIDSTDQRKSNSSHDFLIPKTSNVSFNISFL